MASTYSTNLKVELIGTGDQSGTWGTTTNGNLGTVLEEAIVGKATVDFASDANKTITMGNGPATSDARCLMLYLTSTGSLSATRTLTVPAIKKTYLVENATSGGRSIIISSGGATTVTVPNGKRVMVYVDGSSVYQQFNDLVSGTSLGGSTIATTTGTETLTNKTLEGADLNGGTLAQTVVTTPALIEFGGAVYNTGTIVNKINTTSGSATVEVEITSATAPAVGDYIVMADATAVGGIPALELNRVNIITFASTSVVRFDATTTASSSASGGGTVLFSILPRIVPPSVPTTLVGTSDTATLSSKRIDQRVVSTTTTGTLTPSVATADLVVLTAQASSLTIAAPTGTPLNGQKLIIRLKDNGTARGLSWNAIYRAIATTLPTTTTANKTTYVGCVYNSNDTKWDVLAVATET